ncbi:MAG: cob(I)yrinic acid a,c-diamide adenosyltransferase [Eubacterium sp.]|nr:cob(I)yrinic acid a,c-diamide adenosyltransferase [Eubacterium sp.]
MGSGRVQIYYGDGRGKSTAALGYALQTATAGKNVFLIHFLKGKMATESAFMQRLEPEIKIFHFEKSEGRYEELSEQEKTEENRNIKNGVNFARKVLLNDECSLLVLDELLGVIDHAVVTKEDVQALFDAKAEETQIIVTGRKLPDYLRDMADEIYQIQAEKS